MSIPGAPARNGVPSSLTAPNDPTLHLPRIMCLHGGGTNARIFRAQCRVILTRLQPDFRLVFADAPWLSIPGPDVEYVYGEWGPFRSWLKPIPGLAGTFGAVPQPLYGGQGQGPVVTPISDHNVEECIESVDNSIAAAMATDDEAGATGEWVGLLGFSQGAKMAASLLYRQQMQNSGDGGEIKTRTTPNIAYTGPRKPAYRFAVLHAGRAPLVSLDPDFQPSPFQHGSGEEHVLLNMPTIHVHGTRDPGIKMHRELIDRCCSAGSWRLLEWEGNHRLPIKTIDVSPIVSAINDVARETGIITGPVASNF